MKGDVEYGTTLITLAKAKPLTGEQRLSSTRRRSS
jgi:hypothetical protein